MFSLASITIHYKQYEITTPNCMFQSHYTTHLFQERYNVCLVIITHKSPNPNPLPHQLIIIWKKCCQNLSRKKNQTKKTKNIWCVCISLTYFACGGRLGWFVSQVTLDFQNSTYTPTHTQKQSPRCHVTNAKKKLKTNTDQIKSILLHPYEQQQNTIFMRTVRQEREKDRFWKTSPIACRISIHNQQNEISRFNYQRSFSESVCMCNDKKIMYVIVRCLWIHRYEYRLCAVCATWICSPRREYLVSVSRECISIQHNHILEFSMSFLHIPQIRMDCLRTMAFAQPQHKNGVHVQYRVLNGFKSQLSNELWTCDKLYKHREKYRTGSILWRERKREQQQQRISNISPKTTEIIGIIAIINIWILYV